MFLKGHYTGPGEDMCGLCGLWRDPMGLPWLRLFSESESLLPPSVCVFACLAR